MLTVPYVTTAAFKAHPTFLDLLNLRNGDTALADQTAELNNILLMSSAWADNYCELGDDGTLAAHTRVENCRTRIDRQGRLIHHPDHIPVSTVTGLSYGYTPNSLSPLADLSNVWIEDRRQIVAVMLSAAGLANLQFGPPVYTSDLYTTWTYVAGYANTLLVGSAIVGATSITVADPTGIAAGVTLRIWDPGTEEAVTVAQSYVAGSTTVPLVSPLSYAHTNTAATGVSALPSDIHLAVINYAAFTLMRPDSSAEDEYPSGQRSTAGGKQPQGIGLVEEAERLLEPYRRVR